MDILHDPLRGCKYEETLLKVSDVSKTLGGKCILRDLDLEVKNLVRPGHTQGQVVGLLGPSGMGKTTLFRLLAGLEPPDSGSVLVGQEQKPVLRGQVGVIAQNYPLFVHRTVLGNLLVAGHQAGLSGQKNLDEATALLERFGIAEHKDKYPAQLSGGQRQRVAIAQQFMCSEHFILMDEPFSGLDLLAEDRVIKFVSEIAETDDLKTFILVTHSVSAALKVCDMIWVLGRDRGGDGKPIPGARLQQTFNLVERNIAWRENVSETKEFHDALREISALFPKL